MRISIGILIVSLSGVASAQNVQQTIAEAEALAVRVEREAICLRQKHAELTRTLELIRQAQRQMRAMGVDEAARRDARASIQPLFERMVRIEREALGCRTAPPRRSTRTVAQGVRYRDPPPDPAADAVARNTNDRLIDHAYRVNDRVRVISGERVDGRGRIAPEPVRAAIRRIAPDIAGCGRANGRVLLTFTVTGSGSVRRLTTEGSSVHDRRLLHCVRSTARRMRVGQGTEGGHAVFSYTFDFN